MCVRGPAVRNLRDVIIDTLDYMRTVDEDIKDELENWRPKHTHTLRNWRALGANGESEREREGAREGERRRRRLRSVDDEFSVEGWRERGRERNVGVGGGEKHNTNTDPHKHTHEERANEVERERERVRERESHSHKSVDEAKVSSERASGRIRNTHARTQGANKHTREGGEVVEHTNAHTHTHKQSSNDDVIENVESTFFFFFLFVYSVANTPGLKTHTT